MLEGDRARKDLSLEVEGGTGHDLNFPFLFSLSIIYSLLYFLFEVGAHSTGIKTVRVGAPPTISDTGRCGMVVFVEACL